MIEVKDLNKGDHLCKSCGLYVNISCSTQDEVWACSTRIREVNSRTYVINYKEWVESNGSIRGIAISSGCLGVSSPV